MFPAHSRHSPQPRAAWGSAGLASPVTVVPLPTPSRVVVSAMGLLSVEHWRRSFLIPAGSHPASSYGPTSQGSKKAGKALSLSWELHS